MLVLLEKSLCIYLQSDFFWNFNFNIKFRKRDFL